MARKKKLAPPRQRNAQEQEVYDWIVKNLEESGLLMNTDLMMVDVLAHTYVEWITYAEELEAFKASNGGSSVQTSPNGYQQPHQLVYLVEKRADMVVRQLDKLGMNLESITKITKEKKSTEGKVVDPFEEFTKLNPDA